MDNKNLETVLTRTLPRCDADLDEVCISFYPTLNSEPFNPVAHDGKNPMRFTQRLANILRTATIAVFYLFIFADSGVSLDKNQLAKKSAPVTARSIMPICCAGDVNVIVFALQNSALLRPLLRERAGENRFTKRILKYRYHLWNAVHANGNYEQGIDRDEFDSGMVGRAYSGCGAVSSIMSVGLYCCLSNNESRLYTG